MKHGWKRSLLLLLLAAALLLAGCARQSVELAGDIADMAGQPAVTETVTSAPTEAPPAETESPVVRDGEYTSKDEVALYLHLFGRLPGNYITKNEAYDLGWDNKKGNLWQVAPGKSIGGDRFGNNEGLLPPGKKYFECDIDSDGGYRGSKRIVYSRDGYIYYTEDHYQTFDQLYP